MTTSNLRTLAKFHSGTDLSARVAHAEEVIRQQAEALRWAADEIERLQTELERCKTTPAAA